MEALFLSRCLCLQELKESGELEELLPKARPLEERCVYHDFSCVRYSCCLLVNMTSVCGRLKEVISRERIMLFMKGSVEVT